MRERLKITLFNKTNYPDRDLRKLLRFAGRVIGVKGEVVVKVTTGAPQGGFEPGFPFLWHLTTKRIPRGDKRRGKMIGSRSGWVKMSIPRPVFKRHFTRTEAPPDALVTAWGGRYVFKSESDAALKMFASRSVHVALHEFAHVAQYREGARFDQPETPTGRRIRHGKRPIEVDAENRIYDAVSKRSRLVEKMNAFVFGMMKTLAQALEERRER